MSVVETGAQLSRQEHIQDHNVTQHIRYVYVHLLQILSNKFDSNSFVECEQNDFYVNGHYCCAFQQGYKIFLDGNSATWKLSVESTGHNRGARCKRETQALRERRYRRVALIQRAH